MERTVRISDLRGANIKKTEIQMAVTLFIFVIMVFIGQQTS